MKARLGQREWDKLDDAAFKAAFKTKKLLWATSSAVFDKGSAALSADMTIF